MDITALNRSSINVNNQNNSINANNRSLVEGTLANALNADTLALKSKEQESKPKKNVLNSINLFIKNKCAEIKKMITGAMHKTPEQKLNRLISPELRQDYADLCKAVNRKLQDPSAPVPQGYTVLKNVDSKASGYNATVFESPNNEIIIVNQGTQISSVKDVIANDAKILNGKAIPPQALDAIKLFDEIKEQYPNKPIVLLGHSLGGFITQLTASARDAKAAYSFCGPGADYFIPMLENASLKKGSTDKVVNIIVDNDPIGTLTGPDKNFDGQVDNPAVSGHFTGKKGGVFVVKGTNGDMFENHTLWNSIATAAPYSDKDDEQYYSTAFKNSLKQVHKTAMSLFHNAS